MRYMRQNFPLALRLLEGKLGHNTEHILVPHVSMDTVTKGQILKLLKTMMPASAVGFSSSQPPE